MRCAFCAGTPIIAIRRKADPVSEAKGKRRSSSSHRSPGSGRREDAVGADGRDPPQFMLASASPRRRELLHQMGFQFSIVTPHVDETQIHSETAEAYVRRLAVAKARAGLGLQPSGADLGVLGADTAVAIDGEVLGKPRGRAEGLSMLARLSGRTHVVLSAVAFCSGSACESRVQRSQVRFREIGAHERAAYWASGEPADKAGGYAIQGLAAAFAAHLEGSYTGVMGLPLFETTELLARYGIRTGLLGSPK